MKRLLFVIPTMRMGGAEKALVSLLKSLDPNQVSVDLFLFEHGGILQEQLPPWVRVLPENVITRAMTLELRYYWKDLVKHGKLLAAMTRLWIYGKGKLRSRLHRPMDFSWKSASRFIPSLNGRYDTAISFLEGTTAFFLIDKVSAARKIGWIHTDIGKRRDAPEEHGYYQRFDALVTISEACRGSIVAAFPEQAGRIHVIENISNAEDIRNAARQAPTLPWKAECKHLLTVARLEHQKGIDLALQACRLLASQRSDFQWHVLGDGSMRQWLQAETKASGLENVFLLDGVAANPYPYMKAAYAIVQPSRVEGKSIVLDEAKILGKAILTTNYPSVSDQLIPGKSGLVVEMKPAAISAAVSNLLDDRALVRRLEQACLSLPLPGADTLEAFYQII